jgi:hypothetical protein
MLGGQQALAGMAAEVLAEQLIQMVMQEQQIPAVAVVVLVGHLARIKMAAMAVVGL